MSLVRVNTDFLHNFVETHEVTALQEQVASIHKKLHANDAPDFTGWVNYPDTLNTDELNRIQHIAQEMRNNSDVVVIVGIGGSYLGARAVIDTLKPQLFHKDNNAPEILYAGQNISSTYMVELLDYLKGKRVSIIVISKSGTTTEPALAFRFLKNFMDNSFSPEEVKTRIVAITDAKRGALRKLADKQGYQTFIIPDDIGGRFSAFTPVGLLPMAIAGININKLTQGLTKAHKHLNNHNIQQNEAYHYAVLRLILHRKGRDVENYVSAEPNLHYLTEWCKQLFAESEGKDAKGILPIAMTFSTDLHSLGQYVQDGKNIMFETFINTGKPTADIPVPTLDGDIDGLNYLVGKTVNEVNQTVMHATALAHVEGNVPVISLEMDNLDEETLAYLMYMFMKTTAMAGYLNGVDPFNQPGVEIYKTNVFKLLGKPGY